MADVQPLRALRYEPRGAGPLDQLLSPPYDVIDSPLRERLAARSPYNAVHIDLPVAGEGADPYEHAADLLQTWQMHGALVRDREPALWILEQDYTAPGGKPRRRRGFLGRVRIEDYGPGRVRPHERTHPGPKEDRLRLTRATRANLSPIFSFYSDPSGAVASILEETASAPPWGEASDDDGTLNRLWRLADPAPIDAIQQTLAAAELLIADGHHRYETARVYADEVGGEGEHRFVLMCLVALEDPGLTVFPTHRLVQGLDSERQEALAATVRRDFEITEVDRAELAPPPGEGPLELGYIDSHFKRPFRLRLRDQATADAALPDHSAAYRELDTAVLEAVLLKGALGLTDDDISHLNGLGYARDQTEALAQIDSGDYDAAFVLRPTPIDQVRAVASAGETMPPKSTYFYPKIPTGLVFNLLE
jgi:uncharacterized protein (DUF1015 family)